VKKNVLHALVAMTVSNIGRKEGARTKSRIVAASASALVLAMLQGCGGGGSSGGGGFALSPAASSSDKPAQALDTAPSFKSETLPVSDPGECLTAPQAGSIADVGNGIEGVWEAPPLAGGFSGGTMQIDSAARAQGSTYEFMTLSGAQFPRLDASFYGDLVFSAASSSWQFNLGSGMLYPEMGNPKPLSGNGNFSANSTLSGSYTIGASASRTFGPWTYSPGNSLAVDSTVLAKRWGDLNAVTAGELVVAPDGSFTGVISPMMAYGLGMCAFSGNFRHRDAGTLKNDLVFDFVATDVAQAGQTPCRMLEYRAGSAHVHVTQATAAGVCKRSMSLWMVFEDTARKPLASINFYGMRPASAPS